MDADDLENYLQQINDAEMQEAQKISSSDLMKDTEPLTDNIYGDEIPDNEIPDNEIPDNECCGYDDDTALAKLTARRLQEEEDEKLAKQLMEQFAREDEQYRQRQNPPPPPQPQSHASRRRIRPDDSEEHNTELQAYRIEQDLLDQIRAHEAEETIKKEGNAFDGVFNTDTLMRKMDEEDEEIRRKFDLKLQREKERQLRAEQDAEYEEALKEDMRRESAKQLRLSPQNEPSDLETKLIPVHAPEEPMPVPVAQPMLAPDELRAARMRRFNLPKP